MASKTSGNLIQVKASGLMCSFCTMSVEKALGRVPGVHNVQVNLVHGIILVDADRNQVSVRMSPGKSRTWATRSLRLKSSSTRPTRRSSRRSNGAAFWESRSRWPIRSSTR